MAKKVKLDDIAAFCNVSKATVSRVLNGTAPVKAEVRDKIEHAIRELGYTPNRSISRSKTQKIGLIVPDFYNPFLSDVVNAAQAEASRRGVLLAALGVSQEINHQRENLWKSKKWGFDGLIVVGTKLPPEEFVDFHRQTGIPVIISRMVEIPELPCILIDYESGTNQAIKHLINLGHRNIGCISSLPEWDSEKIKLDSVNRALTNNGTTLSSEHYTWCFPNIAEGVQAANRLLNLDRSKRPTAIFAFDDLIALGVLYAAENRGIKIPEELSLIGFNDIDYAAYTNPPLSTVALPTQKAGQLLVIKICEHLRNDNPNFGGLTALKCEFTVRESTAAPLF
ncbi:MAG TPA: LacI family transcriptional regulator [Sediminispirochaeta sp.]|nr:LacI family transcriptional regulator [Sediminispirochaeta sp.]